MKLFTALLGTETNTFSPFATGRQNFAETYLVRGGAHGDNPTSFAIPLVVWRAQAEARGWSVAEGVAAFAMPAGLTRRDVYESLRDEVLADLRAALPVDAVLLNMHGAMIADGYDDCEGDLATAVREIVGPDVPIGVELDLHCHLTQQLVEAATAIITYKEYPHTDYAERAVELFQIIADTLAGQVQPHITLHDCRMIGVFHTTQEPMKSIVAEMQEWEQRPGVLAVSVGHGFPWGDVPDLGTRVLVVTDDDPALGQTVAAHFGDKLFTLRDSLQPNYLSIDAALDRALASDRTPVVLADVSDNAGGGAPNDSTFVLRAMLERGIKNAALACIWDPVAVRLAMEAGEGATFDIRLGGKMGPMSGDPLDLTVTVTGITPNALQREQPSRAKLGDAVALHTQGIDIVVNSLRGQTLSPGAFRCVGIDPTTKRLLVVKSMQHFHADFAPIAGAIMHVAAPGALYPNLAELPYKRANRQMWPLTA